MNLSFARRSRKLVSVFCVFAGALISLPTMILPAQSAERIQFFFGPFEPTIYVEDLETFAKTGEVTDQLKPVASRFNDEQLANLRVGLNAQYELNPIPVAQFTYSTLGENLLGKLGQVVQTDNFLNGMKGIRAALILAAANEEQGGLTALNVMRHFPSQTIQIDFSLAREIATENVQIFRRRDHVITEIKQFARSQSVGGDAPTTDEDPRQAGDHAWQVETISFQTPGRLDSSLADLYLPDISSEQVNAPIEDLSDRAISGRGIPVVVISHGVASTRNTLAYMAEHLASHGYAVVSIEHTETSAENFSRFLWGKGSAPGGQELLLRPRDITAVLDLLSIQQADAQQANNRSALSDLNLESVGVLGQSLGGYTVLAASGATIDRTFLDEACQSSLAERPTLNLSLLTQCTLLELPADTSMPVADERVAAVVALNPLTSSIFGMSGLQKIKIPVMMMAGSDDYVAPALPEQIEPFDWLTTEHKKLVVMDKGTHFSFLDRNAQSVLPFSEQLTGPDPMAAREPTRALSLAFFNQHLQQQAEAERFLTQTYLESFPTEPFRFSVVDSLPPTSAR